MRNTVIECKNVHKEFISENNEKINVVHNLNLSVGENEFVVLFGPGQCGKTTAMKVMSGLLPATSGSVTVNGKEVTAPGPERGVIYQNTLLFPWMTVMGNVDFGLRCKSLRKAERKERAQYYIDLVGLTGFEKAFPAQLSGGMQQRVGIARAYCIEPTVMFMDEPFGHLDAQTRYLMQEELIRIWEKEKRTIIFITNNIEEAIYLADRIIVLDRCPTSVKCSYKIDFPRPRNYTMPEFLALRKEISEVVKSGHSQENDYE